MHVDWLMVKAKSLLSNVVLFFAISYFSEVIDYCRINPDHGHLVPVELDASLQVVILNNHFQEWVTRES